MLDMSPSFDATTLDHSSKSVAIAAPPGQSPTASLGRILAYAAIVTVGLTVGLVVGLILVFDTGLATLC